MKLTPEQLDQPFDIGLFHPEYKGTIYLSVLDRNKYYFDVYADGHICRHLYDLHSTTVRTNKEYLDFAIEEGILDKNDWI